jgi:hypothetical protein
MLVECTAETNLDPKEAHELLLGNLENDSREAKVGQSESFDQKYTHSLLSPVFRQMSLQEGRFPER